MFYCLSQKDWLEPYPIEQLYWYYNGSLDFLIGVVSEIIGLVDFFLSEIKKW